MASSLLPPNWGHDLQLLKRWSIAYFACWLGLWVADFAGATAGIFAVLLLLAIVPYIVSIVYAYRVWRGLNMAGLYKPGAWQVIVAALLLNPIFFGWLVLISVLRMVRRVRRSHAAQLLV